MLETKRPGLTVTEEPGGMLRKQLMDYDGTVLLDETVLPHDDLICFIHRPLKKYSQQLTELENHPLFKESLDISILDFQDLVAKCFAVANDLKTDFPEAYFLMRIALEDILVEEDDGSASFLLNTGTKMVQAVRALYFTRVRMRNIMEICFGTTEIMTQEKRWTRTATVYPQLYTYAFSVRWKAEGDEWVREYEMHSLLELYFFEVCAALRSEKRIVRCQHCWQYFVPKTKKKTDYCDRTWEDGSTCKKRGPNLKRKDGPNEDIYLLAFKKLRARFYERDYRFYAGIPGQDHRRGVFATNQSGWRRTGYGESVPDSCGRYPVYTLGATCGGKYVLRPKATFPDNTNSGLEHRRSALGNHYCAEAGKQLQARQRESIGEISEVKAGAVIHKRKNRQYGGFSVLPVFPYPMLPILLPFSYISSAYSQWLGPWLSSQPKPGT